MRKYLIILSVILFFLPNSGSASFRARLLSDLTYYWSSLKYDKFVTEIRVQGLFYETSINMKVRLARVYHWRQGCVSPQEGNYEFIWNFYFPDESIITDVLIWDENEGKYVSPVVIDLETAEKQYDPNSPNTPQLLLREYRGRNWSGKWDLFYELKLASVKHDEVKDIIIKYITPCRMYWAVRRIEVRSRQFYSPSDPRCNTNRAPAEFKLIDYDNPDIPPKHIHEIPLTWEKQNDYWYTKTGPEIIRFNYYSILSVAKESQSGNYLQTYSNGNHQFYQLATLPHIQDHDRPGRHIIICFDLIDEKSYSPSQYISRDRILDELKYPLSYATTGKDSLAFVTTLFTVKWLDKEFIPRTPEIITSRLDSIKELIPKLSSLPFILREAVQFLNDRNLSGEIWFISNAKHHSSPAATALDIIQQTHFKANNPIKFRIVDATFLYVPSYRINNKYYRGNEYLYENLSRLSKGSFLIIRDQNYYDRVDALMDCLTPVVSSVEVDAKPDQGLAYSRIPINWNRKNFNITSRYFEIGLFDGNTPFNVHYFGNLNDKLYSMVFTFEPNNNPLSEEILKNMKTFWYAQYINELLQQPQSYATINYITQLAVENHILSPYSGFILPGQDGLLAFQKLVPEDTIIVEENVEKNEYNLPKDFTLSAFPNPFNPRTNIIVEIPEVAANNPIEIFIVNTLGQTIKTYQLKNSEGFCRTQVEWDGRNDSDQPVTSGIYFVILKSSGIVKSYKITLLR